MQRTTGTANPLYLHENSNYALVPGDAFRGWTLDAEYARDQIVYVTHANATEEYSVESNSTSTTTITSGSGLRLDSSLNSNDCSCDGTSVRVQEIRDEDGEYWKEEGEEKNVLVINKNESVKKVEKKVEKNEVSESSELEGALNTNNINGDSNNLNNNITTDTTNSRKNNRSKNKPKTNKKSLSKPTVNKDPVEDTVINPVNVPYLWGQGRLGGRARVIKWARCGGGGSRRSWHGDRCVCVSCVCVCM